jgi:5-methylcytosine-specific restriction protein A
LRLAVPGYAPQDHARLERDLANADPDAGYRSADEPDPRQTYSEGTLTQVKVNRYERDPRARQDCLDHYGYRCQACDLDFGERYGPLGAGFIHVHHTKELSTVGPGYEVHPVNDLRPLCPNCHAMVHQVSPAMPVKDLRTLLSGPR